jgi:hypothetical protein
MFDLFKKYNYLSQKETEVKEKDGFNQNTENYKNELNQIKI